MLLRNKSVLCLKGLMISSKRELSWWTLFFHPLFDSNFFFFGETNKQHSTDPLTEIISALGHVLEMAPLVWSVRLLLMQPTALGVSTPRQ